jgi:predicted AlkP superfamily pyrophosphatase or phosphodiesterase
VSATRKKLVLVVIDGLTPAMLEAAVERGSAPTLALLVESGRYTTATTTFPSLTPVCMTTIATGAHPDVHEIPHLVWWHRDERRIVEYGSSFAAIRRAGTLRSMRDTILLMNREHMSKRAVTVFEALEDAGLVPAAVNITAYRGRTKHRALLPGIQEHAYGPKRFFYYNLFESDRTGAPLAIRARTLGSIDAYAAAVGRWLVTRDGFDFLTYYLPDYDYASHVQGPDAAHEALARSDAAVAALLDAAGGADAFLERYAVILCSDHGQTRAERSVRLEDSLDALPGVLVTASNRAAMVYRLEGAREDVPQLVARLDGEQAVGVALYMDGAEAVARRAGEELRFDADGPVSGDAQILDQPDALARAWAALQNPNAGEILISAAAGYEFADLGGRHHVGGGSHGSLDAGDSIVPVVTVGLDADIRSTIDVMPAVLSHFGVEAPAYARAVARVG